MSTDLRERILKVSDEYIRLVQLISPIATVPLDLAQNQENIYTVSGKLEAKRKLVSDLGKKSKRLFEEYKSHGSGFVRRLSLRLEGTSGGKRSDTIEHSRFKWEEARTEEGHAQEAVTQLESQLAQAEQQANELRSRNQILDRLNSELEVLNQQLFVGETPEFPMEDASECSVLVIEATQRFLSNELAREKRAREKIISGIDSMTKAVEELKTGLDVGQKIAKSAAPYLLNAKTHLARCHVIWEEACTTQKIISPLKPMEILRVHLLPGGTSNRALGERAALNSLEQSYSQARNNLSLMRRELSQSRSRTDFFIQRTKLLSSQLLETKNSLMRVRCDIVQDIASGGSGNNVRGEFGGGANRNRSRTAPIDDGIRNEKEGEANTSSRAETSSRSERGNAEEETRSLLDPSVIRKRAIDALREILRQVTNKDLEHEYQFECLPDYDDT